VICSREWDLDELETQSCARSGRSASDVAELAPETIDRERLKDDLDEDAMAAYDEREDKLGEELMRHPRALDPAERDRQPLARTPLRHGLPARGHPPSWLRPDRPARGL